MSGLIIPGTGMVDGNDGCPGSFLAIVSFAGCTGGIYMELVSGNTGLLNSNHLITCCGYQQELN